MTVVSPRPLPKYLSPVTGEAFASYVDRCSYELDVPALALLETVFGGTLDPLLSRYGYAYSSYLAESPQRTFAEAAGIDPELVAAMFLSSHAGSAVALTADHYDDASVLQRELNHQWLLLGRSRACPACLAGDGGAYQLRWKLASSFACVRHRCMLAEVCPRCGESLPRDPPKYRSAGSPLLPLVVKPGSCGNRAPTCRAKHKPTACGAPLTEIAVTRLDRASPILAAQHLIDGVLTKSTGRSAAANASTWLSDLRAVSALVLAYATRAELGELPPSVAASFEAHIDARNDRTTRSRHRPRPTQHRGFISYYRRVPDVALVAAVAPISVAVVSALADGTVDDAVARLEPILKRTVRPGIIRASAAFAHASPALRQAIDRCIRDRSGVTYSSGLTPSPRALTRRGYSFRADHVPQLLWADVFEREFSSILPLPPSWQMTARRYLSTALVKLAESRSWKSAAEALELPQTSTVHEVKRLINRAGTSEQVARQLHKIAAALDSEPSRIDFGERRRALAKLTTIPARVWIKICTQTQTSSRNDALRRAAAVWVWTELTQGDPRLSPAAAHKRRWAILGEYRRLCSTESVGLTSALTAYSATLIDAARLDSRRSRS